MVTDIADGAGFVKKQIMSICKNEMYTELRA
jgi:hypothetical protein